MADFGIGVPDEIARLSLGHSEEPPPPPPQKDVPGVIPVDITKAFQQACGTLEPGQLIKDGFFTLFESVSALEIMDPKMDSGCVVSGDEFDELYDVSRPLLPEEVLGIIDELICHEMSWHMGYPLSQTLLTNVYVEALSMPDPATIELARFVRDKPEMEKKQPMLRVLRAYCLGLLKACAYVNHRVKSEHYYEEEDFVTNTYNRTLLTRIPTADIRSAIDQARDLLKEEKEAIGAELFDALSTRLELRKVFLDAAESPQYMKNLELAKAPWLAALPLLPIIKDTHQLSKPVDEAFSAKLQKKLASTMPPRAIVKLKFDDAFVHLSRLFTDGSELIDVLNYHDSQSLLTFVRNFQSKKPQPLVYIRTLLQTFLFDSMQVLGSMSIRQLLDDDFSIITLPASQLLDRDNDEIEAVQDIRFTMSQQLELFRQRAAQPFLDIFRTFCQNRCRVRRTLCHVIREWENLQFDAEDIDDFLQKASQEHPPIQQNQPSSGLLEPMYSLPLSSWAFLYKIRMMEEIVLLGFELEVYQPDETSGMYWYLNLLAKSRLQHTERIKSFMVQKVDEARNRPGGINTTVENQLHRSLSHIRLSLLDAAVTWELSDALASLYLVLNRLQLIKPVNRPYSTDRLRYDLRMKPFAPIGLPVLPTFEEFKASTLQEDVSSKDLLEQASRSILGAKKGLETLAKLSDEDSFSVGSHAQWTANIKRTLKSCIATSLAITTLQKAVGSPQASPGAFPLKAEIPTPDKAYHEWWLVPSISPI